jgi:hypothetical protein
MYTTSDIDLAASLMACGHKLTGVLKSPEGRKGNTLFGFDKDGVKKDVIRYLNSEITVDARKILTRFRELKNIAHNKDFDGEDYYNSR